MSVTINGSTGVTTPGISNSEGYTGDGLTIAAGAPSGAVAVDSSGNVGIGTSSPTNKLTVYAGADGDVGFFRGGSTRQVQIGTSSTAGYINTDNGSAGLEIRTQGTARMYVDNSGNLGLGVTPTAQGNYAVFDIKGRATGQSAILSFFDGAGTQTGAIQSDTNYGVLVGASGARPIAFYTNGAERARIDSSGNLLVGTTSQIQSGQVCISYASATRRGLVVNTDTTSTTGQIAFVNPNGIVGQITTSGSSTAYVTSSDYRLKNTIAPMTGALAKVAALKPVTYKWNVDGSDGEGFIAHELAEVVPQCVTGEKDAVDDEGKPVYQGIDTSFLVATLTAAIQEQQALIESLTARVVALEGAQIV